MFYSKYFFGKGVVKECMWVKARMHAVQLCKFEQHILCTEWTLIIEWHITPLKVDLPDKKYGCKNKTINTQSS